MITKEDRALARKTIERLDRYESGSPRMVQALAEVIEDIRTRAWAEGFSRGTGQEPSADSGNASKGDE